VNALNASPGATTGTVATLDIANGAGVGGGGTTGTGTGTGPGTGTGGGTGGTTGTGTGTTGAGGTVVSSGGGGGGSGVAIGGFASLYLSANDADALGPRCAEILREDPTRYRHYRHRLWEHCRWLAERIAKRRHHAAR
jgi:hypothetical protein